MPSTAMEIPRPCSVGYAQTIPGIFIQGITLQRTSVSSVGHSYPYPELLEVVYDIHTRTRNFWKFGTPVPQIRGVRVYNIFLTYVSSVRPCHNTRNFCEICNTSVPYPELLPVAYCRCFFPIGIIHRSAVTAMQLPSLS